MLRFTRSGVWAWLPLAAVTALVCPAQFSYFGAESAAKVVQIAGQVSVLKDSQPWALALGSEVKVRQVIVTGADGYAVFEVSDGSSFEVYPNSRVTFRNTPGNLKDLLDLAIGRVKVHIQKLGGQPNHNKVRTPTAIIAVRGTIFDVVVEDELETTLVAVEEGQVEVRHSLMPSDDGRLVNAGEYLRVYRNVPIARKRIDKGSVMQQALRAVGDAIYTTLSRVPGTGGSRIPTGGSGGGSTPLPGDTEAPAPPPPPSTADPNPAPPPPPGN